MLDRATRIRWTQDVVAFLNGENDGTWLGGGPEWLTLAPPSERSRKNAERELRFVAKELSQLRESEKWSAANAAKIQLPKSIRLGVGEDELERWNSPVSVPIGAFVYDEAGHVVMSPSGEFPTEVVLALTITELLATDSPVEVKVCQYEKCNKLFVHEVVGQRRPREYCCTNHSARQRKLRLKTRDKRPKIGGNANDHHPQMCHPSRCWTKTCWTNWHAFMRVLRCGSNDERAGRRRRRPMRKPEKIRRKDGTCVYQVRSPKPSGGMQYSSFRTKHEAEAFASELHAARVRHRDQYHAQVRRIGQGVPRRALRRAAPFGHRGLRPRVSSGLSATWAASCYAPSSATDIEKMRDAELLAIRGRNLAMAESALARAERRLVAAKQRAQTSASTRQRSRSCGRGRQRSSAAATLSVNKMVGALRTLLKFAQSRGYVVQNVASFVKKLKAQPMNEKPLDQAVLTPAELAALVAATDPDWRAAIGVLGYGGLRIGELLGLQWGDVELDKGRVLVRRQLCNVSHELREPKDQSGQALRRAATDGHQGAAHVEVCAARKASWTSCSPTAGAARRIITISGRGCFTPRLRRAGVRRVRIHDLRHGAASMMIAAGCDIAAVSRQLGHANVSITLGTYSHWFDQRTESGVAARLAAFLEAEGKRMVAFWLCRPRRIQGKRRKLLILLAPRERFELPTNGLTVRRSTTELPGNAKRGADCREARPLSQESRRRGRSCMADHGVRHVRGLELCDLGLVQIEFESCNGIVEMLGLGSAHDGRRDR